MHHGDGFTSVASGILFSLVANIVGWVGTGDFASHVVQSLLFGFVGGIGGLLAKWTVRTVRQHRTSNKDNQPR